MKQLLKNIIALMIAILLNSFTSLSYGEQTHDSLYNPNVAKQSVLFTFLEGHLFLKAAAEHLKQKDYSCDLCKLQNHLEFTEDLLNDLQELGFHRKPKDVLFDSVAHLLEEEEVEELPFESCDLCRILEDLPFKDLHEKLLAKLQSLAVNESYQLFLKVEKVAVKIEKIIAKARERFEEIRDSEEDIDSDIEYNKVFKELYSQIKALGNFPNILDKASVFETVENEIAEFAVDYEKDEEDKQEGFDKLSEKEFNELHLNLDFIESLVNYKNFLDVHIEILSQIEQIANNDFKMEIIKEWREIEALSEIMSYAEKMLQLKYEQMACIDLL